MTYDDVEEIKKLIPFYVNNTLSKEERQMVKEALEKYPELKKELLECSQLKELYCQTTVVPSPYLFNRIKKNISKKESLSERINSFLRNIYKSQTISWGLVAIQAVIILFFIWHINSTSFKTLSITSKQKGAYINVVFYEDIQEKEMRALLNQIGATIVEGPSKEGLYIIKLKEAKEADKALEILKKSKKIKFIAKSYR